MSVVRRGSMDRIDGPEAIATMLDGFTPKPWAWVQPELLSSTQVSTRPVLGRSGTALATSAVPSCAAFTATGKAITAEMARNTAMTRPRVVPMELGMRNFLVW
ncbi:hypothetical protein GCM10009789_73400 [Kribbella sancticallisti]|uniref:Uncharacterized protein n=1 Tax=Kribbella sancticallisti TaxID=460087 RepID=A0ABN2EIB3_9ACTN